MLFLWDVWSYLTSVDGAKFLSAIAASVTILSGGYGFLKAYRYGERQIGYRLAEFLAKEEERLAEARQALGGLVRRPNPSQHPEPSLFPRRALRGALRRMGWGVLRAENHIAAAAIRCEQQVALARRQTSLHEKEQALSYLLLGAIADAQSDHAGAFAEFEKALKLDGEDVESLEYAGLQLLKLNNAIGASEYFAKLAAIAEARRDQSLAARAYQQQALACEQLGSLVQANSLLVRATSTFPANADPLDLAFAHEQHGRVRRKAGFDNANQSLQKALALFSSMATAQGKNGADRIKQAIKELNDRNTHRAQELQARDTSSGAV
ncbi:MAG: hypothetical protein K2X43_04160 [Hyphomonadaceae bacterium]|jgi:tetratricopeptide (TPR) repeat protein|nr:hypothetical protein [Hyphomonadaceae bacterium]